MTDLLAVLPEFDVHPYSTLISSLEQAGIKTADLLSLDALEVAKRARAHPSEARLLVDAIIQELRKPFPPTGRIDNGGEDSKTSASRPATQVASNVISTLDSALDASLDGGVRSGCLTEIVGESAVGKTQFLLSLLLSAQLPHPYGLNKSVLYISTEAPLQTARLQQILSSHPFFTDLPNSEKPSMSRIHSTHIHDVESQEHILRYQVPVAIQRQNVGLLVIDSIAANYRAEFSKGKGAKGTASFAQRSSQVTQLGTLLRSLAQRYQIAVVVANQVADRFDNAPTASQRTDVSQTIQPSNTTSATSITAIAPVISGNHQTQTSLLSTEDPLALDHQQRFFTGWGENPSESNLKTPSLGLMWTNQLDTRIALHREPIYDERMPALGEDREIIGWKRYCKVIFSNWCAEGSTLYEIWEGGIRSIKLNEETSEQ